ncbi:hypothetical protein JCM5353_001991 [Sporobolomyces roseus]
MHGVKRSRVPPIQESAEVERKKRDKQLGMIQDYTRLVDQLQEKMKSEEYTNDTLQLSTNVLALNPEFHTGWAMRRRILVHGLLPLAESNEARQTILSQDLNLTNQSLKLNPKNYSVWEHRKWVLDTMPDADWSMEMKMVELYLEKDGRNFHTWDYRRYLIESILAITPEQQESRTKQIKKPTIESELAFTKKKIGENFSNFSAWHYRTKLLGKMWEEKGWGEENEERRKRVDEEFELVKQAIWSDPNDQSAWLYQRWLVGTGSIELVRREIEGIEELLDEEPDSRWCLDSLIHYKRLLVKLLDSETDREEREKLILECKEMLDRLVKIDPMRVNRYRDIALQIVPGRR